jgi:hypothetical protein
MRAAPLGVKRQVFGMCQQAQPNGVLPGMRADPVVYGAAELAQQLRAPDYVLHDMLEEAYGPG